MPEDEGCTAAEMAYGVLWRCDIEPTHTTRHARLMLKIQIGKEGQRRGIEWALRTFGPRDPIADLHRMM